MTPEQKERQREYNRLWREQNKERVDEARRLWNEQHPERRRATARRCYRKLVEKNRLYAHARHLSGRAWLQALKLKSGGCVDCGGFKRLEFDHVDKASKLFSVSTRTRSARKSLLAEIAKCVVRCKSCHSKRHAAEQRAA